MHGNYEEFRSPQFRVLSDTQVQHIQLATLQILERTGVTIESLEALELLGDAGADVSDPERVKIPPRLVEQAIRDAPRTFTLYTRDGEPAVVLDGLSGPYFGAVPNPREIHDPRTGKRRPCYVEDMVEGARLIDALPNISWSWNGTSSLTLPVVGDEDLTGRVSLVQALVNCSKPLAVESTTLASLKEMLDVCYVVAGGEDQFRRRPFFISSSEPVTPLVQGSMPMNKSLFCAEKGVPNIVYSMPMTGTTTPATFEACLAIANAEMLSQLTVIQLKRPGAPVVLGSIPSIMDMRTTIFSYGAPEMSWMVAALTEIVHSYGLPMFGTAACTDADVIGIQAAIEITYQILTTSLAGADLVHDVGLTYHATAASPELIVLADEVIGMSRVMLRGMSFTRETLPLDMIERMGPKSNFLTEQHTLRHFREFWAPKLFDRSFSSDSRSEACEDRLKKRTLELMTTHKPEPLAEGTIEELRRMEEGWLKRMGLIEYPRRPLDD